MMRSFTILLLALSITSVSDLMAQNLTGQVLDQETGDPIEFASVGLFNQADSSLVIGGVTDDRGVFDLTAPEGQYYARIEFVSYGDQVISDINLVKGRKTALPPTNMGVTTNFLEEVTVQAERTQMEMALDKKIYNIGKDLSNLGGSATDILDNLPSVQVDVDGNVSLRGSDDVRILIDGKPSGLVGLSSNDALRQINGNLIERVEIITNPSARYDAEGEAGIINLVLKKDKKNGVNGSFIANTGWPHNHGAAINLNVRRKWINFFTNFGTSYRKNPGGGDTYQEFGDPIEQITEVSRDNERGGLNYNTRFGADIFFNDFNSLTFSFLYRYSDEDNLFETSYDDFYPQDNVDSSSYRVGNELEGDENLEYAVNYTKTFQQKGRKWTADLQYQNNNEIEDADLVESIIEPDGDLDPFLFQRSINEELEERWMLQSEYVHPFAADGEFEMGFRYTDRLVANDYIVEEMDENGDFQLDPNFTNDFEYQEKVAAAYAMVGNKFDQISWQLGLRYEMTDLTTDLKTTDEQTHQRYNNLFPSAFVTYQLTEQQSFQVSYSRRIRRPRGRFLNPFSSITDRRNLRLGNPNLRPVYTDSYELGYLVNLDQASIYTGVFYRHSDDVYQRIQIVDEDGITYSQPHNITQRDDFGIELNFSREFAKWYSLNGNMNFFHSTTEGGSVMFGEQEVMFDQVQTTSFSGRINNNMKISGLFNAQLNVIYRAPQETVQGRRLSMTSVDLGFSRDIMKGNATLALNVRDLFNSRKYRGEVFSEGFYQIKDYQWRRRSVLMTFTYRLNQKKQRQRRSNRGGFEGGDDEF